MNIATIPTRHRTGPIDDLPPELCDRLDALVAAVIIHRPLGRFGTMIPTPASDADLGALLRRLGISHLIDVPATRRLVERVHAARATGGEHEDSPKDLPQ